MVGGTIGEASSETRDRGSATTSRISSRDMLRGSNDIVAFKTDENLS